MTPFIDMGGYRLTITEDRYADGRKCFVAEHPELPGCVAYAPSREAALEALKEARSAFLSSVQRHEGSAPVTSAFRSGQPQTSSSGEGMELQTA